MSKNNSGRLVILVLIVSGVVFSGCLNAELNTKINRDLGGKRTMHLEMEPVVYAALENNLSRESLTGVQGSELLTYSKDIKNGKVLMDIAIKYKDLRTVKYVRITEHDKILRYEDSTFESVGEAAAKSMSGAVSIKYTVEMPYKIENSNADTIQENKATWVIVDLTSRTLYAESKIPAIPGFTAINLLMVGLISLMFVRKHILSF